MRCLSLIHHETDTPWPASVLSPEAMANIPIHEASVTSRPRVEKHPAGPSSPEASEPGRPGGRVEKSQEAAAGWSTRTRRTSCRPRTSHKMPLFSFVSALCLCRSLYICCSRSRRSGLNICCCCCCCSRSSSITAAATTVAINAMQLPPAFPGDSTTEARVVQRIADGELAHAQLQDGRELEIRELAVLGRRTHILDQPVDLRPRQLRRPAGASLGRRIARLACPLDLAVRDALALGDFFVREALRAQPKDVCPRFLRQVSGHAGDGEGPSKQSARRPDSRTAGFRIQDRGCRINRGREAASRRALLG